jgi:BirA family biotin operon repressor/biotin-[acetyl-CoA-carboxylase] ligase
MKIGEKIIRVKSCPSTNTLAKDLALSGEKEGTVVISEEQTRGKGTKGRSWYSARRKGLYLSVILYPSRPDISLLSLVTGLAASDAVLSSFDVKVSLKWPNDLVWEGKKVGGILCESGYLGNRVNYAILGMGLNLNHDRGDFPEEIRQQAVSLKLITKEDIEEGQLLGNLWQELNHWYGQFLLAKREGIVKAFQKRSVLAVGREMTVDMDGEMISGIYRGINLQGGLILECEGEKKILFSAEVTALKGPTEEG